MAFFGSAPKTSSGPSFSSDPTSGSSNFGSSKKTGADFFGGAPEPTVGNPFYNVVPDEADEFWITSPPTVDGAFIQDTFRLPEDGEEDGVFFFTLSPGIDGGEGFLNGPELGIDGGEGASLEDIAEFAGVSQDSIRDLIPHTGSGPTNGDAVILFIPATSDPQRVTFFYEFISTEDSDITDPTSSINDFSFAATSDGQVFLLADTAGVNTDADDDSQSTGFVPFTVSIDGAEGGGFIRDLEDSEGFVSIVLAVMNAGDTAVDPSLRIAFNVPPAFEGALGGNLIVPIDLIEQAVGPVGVPGESEVGGAFFG